MTPTISEMVARYDMADGQFITLRHRDGKVHITAANMIVETGDEVKAIIKDFKSRTEPKSTQPQPESKPKSTKTQPGVNPSPSQKRGRHLWTDGEKLAAMKMYADGEDLGEIADKFGSTKFSVLKIMQKAGVKRPWPTKGNPSQLQAVEPEPQPEAEESPH